MDTRQLARIDLNLLVALQVLLEERNVSRAAERLFISQSAMSKTLGRLRTLLDDPLFTRTSSGMLPSPRAEELQAGLVEVLRGVQGLVAPQKFDPMSYVGEFNIAIAEYISIAVLPVLMEELQREAPHIRILAQGRIEHQLDTLANGGLDFAIHMERSDYGQDFHVEHLGGLPPIFLARRGHPLWGRSITWEGLASYRHVSLFVPDAEELEFVRQKHSFFEYESMVEEVFETSHLFTALEVVRRTDCLLPAPPFLASHPQLSAGLVSLPIPQAEELMINYMLVTHKRTDSSLPHQWLRNKISNIVARFKEQREQETGNPYEDYRVDSGMRWGL